VPLVTSATRAIMGPCVVTHDKYGNSLFDASDRLRSAEEAAANGGTPGGSVSPVSDTRSEGDVTDAKKIAASPSLQALPVPGKSPSLRALSVPLPGPAQSLPAIAAPAFSLHTSDASPSGTPKGTPTPLDAGPVASLSTLVSQASSRRITSTSTPLPSPSRGKKGVMTYMLTAKCSTEFLGYVSMLGNFALVHAATGPVSSQKATDIADAAGGLLSMPRAKHALAQKAQQEHGRLRTESF
jgi:hypothetical protein